MSADHEHNQDIFSKTDGSEEFRDPWVIEGDDRLSRTHDGSVCVHEGATFTIARGADLRGSLTLRAGSSAQIDGRHSGSLTVSEDAVATVVGDQSGSVTVQAGGQVDVADGGKLAGSLTIAGLVVNRGIRGGTVTLRGGEVRDVDGGSEKPPEVRDGQNVYRW